MLLPAELHCLSAALLIWTRAELHCINSFECKYICRYRCRVAQHILYDSCAEFHCIWTYAYSDIDTTFRFVCNYIRMYICTAACRVALLICCTAYLNTCAELHCINSFECKYICRYRCRVAQHILYDSCAEFHCIWTYAYSNIDTAYRFVCNYIRMYIGAVACRVALLICCTAYLNTCRIALHKLFWMQIYMQV